MTKFLTSLFIVLATSCQPIDDSSTSLTHPSSSETGQVQASSSTVDLLADANFDFSPDRPVSLELDFIHPLQKPITMTLYGRYTKLHAGLWQPDPASLILMSNTQMAQNKFMVTLPNDQMFVLLEVREGEADEVQQWLIDTKDVDDISWSP